MRSLHARLYADHLPGPPRDLTQKEKVVYGLGITAAGAAGGLVLGSLAVSAVGSAAVALHTSVGHVFAGGLLTSLKTAGLFGLRAVGLGALTAAGAAAGGMVGSILVGNKKKSIPVEDLQKVFDKYDTDKDGFIMNSQLKNVFKDLDIDLKEEEQIDIFFKATNRPFDIYGDISYKDFLKLFEVKSLDEDKLRGMLNNLYIKVEDSKGYVSLEDVKEILPLLNVNASDEEVEEIYKNVSNGGTGKLLSRLQFLEMFGFEPMKSVSEIQDSTKQSPEIPEPQQTVSETLKKVCKTVSNVGNDYVFSRFQFSDIFSFEPSKPVSETQEPTETHCSSETPDTHENSETQKEANGNVSTGGGNGNLLSWFQFSDIFSFEPPKAVSETEEPTERQHPPVKPNTIEALETVKESDIQETLKKPETQKISKTLNKPENSEELPETQETSDIPNKPGVSMTQETSDTFKKLWEQETINKSEVTETQKKSETLKKIEIPVEQKTLDTLKKPEMPEKQEAPNKLKKRKRVKKSKTPNKSHIPVAQKSPETQETSDIPKKPEIPEEKTPETLKKPEITETEKISETSKKLVVPEEQKTPETQKKPEITETEKASKKLVVPEEQKTPETLKKPETQKKQETEEMLMKPETLKEQEIPEISEVVGAAFNNLKDIWNKYL